MSDGPARRWGAAKFIFLALLGATTISALAACSGGGGGAADSDDFPSERIEMIVPWAAGGGTDQTGRQLAAAAEETCDTNIVVSNQTGSTGAVGHRAAADAEPDGYTVGLATAELAIVEHLGVAQITPEDVTAVMQYNLTPGVVSVPSDSPYESIDDLVAAAEEQDLTVSTSGTGSIWHIGYAGMNEKFGVEMTNVPFDGSAPAIASTLGGQTDANSAGIGEIVAQVEAGELRPLVVMAEERVEQFPDTPTLQELGTDWTNGAWRGLVVANGTPDDRVQALNECFKEAYETEDFQGFMNKQGFGLQYKPAEEFETFMQEEYERFGQVLEDLDIQ